MSETSYSEYNTTILYLQDTSNFVLLLSPIPFHPLHLRCNSPYCDMASLRRNLIFLYLILVSSILFSLESAMCHSGWCPPKLSLVFPLYSSSRAKYCMARWEFLRQLSVKICTTNTNISRRIGTKSINQIVQILTFVSKATWNI